MPDSPCDLRPSRPVRPCPVPIACAVPPSPRRLFFSSHYFVSLSISPYFVARARSFLLLGPLLSLPRRVVESGNS